MGASCSCGTRSVEVVATAPCRPPSTPSTPPVVREDSEANAAARRLQALQRGSLQRASNLSMLAAALTPDRRSTQSTFGGSEVSAVRTTTSDAAPSPVRLPSRMASRSLARSSSRSSSRNSARSGAPSPAPALGRGASTSVERPRPSVLVEAARASKHTIPPKEARAASRHGSTRRG